MDTVKYPKYDRPRKVGAYNCLTRNYALLTTQLPFPTRVLDIGCGVGDTSKLLTYFNNVVRVMAIDRSPEMVAVADCFNDDLRIQYELADIEDRHSFPKTTNRGDPFDLVTAFRTLRNVRDHAKALTNVARMLRSGGYFLCTLPARSSQRDTDLDEFLYRSERWRQYRSKKHPSDLARRSQEEPMRDPAVWFAELLISCGFVVDRCEVINEEVAISEEEALEYLKMRRLREFNVSESEYEEFVDEAYKAFSKSTTQLADGYVSWTFQTIDVVARKP